MNDRRASIIIALIPSIAVLCVLAGMGAGYVLWGRPLATEPRRKIGDAMDHIRKQYYSPPTDEKLADAAIEGMAAKLDPYCQYFTKEEWEEFNSVQLQAQFGGVGVLVEPDRASGFLNIVTPIEETPAFTADILPGDQIREVDGKSIKGQNQETVVRKIKGTPGTKVTLTLHRKGRDPFQVTLTRRLIKIKAVKARMLEEGVGYVRISDFSVMMDQFDAEAKKLLDQGMKAMVIDLRFNGGGLLGECVKLADRFLDDGIIVTTQGRTPEDLRKEEAKKGDTLPALPLVILVNEASASASEVFAGAMKDRGRGVLVGGRTYGKGSVQSAFELPGGAHLKITTARYFTPGGYSVHREEGKKEYGLDPDFRVEMSNEEYSKLMKKWSDERIIKGEAPAVPADFKDHQMDAALEIIRAKLAGREAKVEARILPAPKPSDN